jgi:hypothetical protein
MPERHHPGKFTGIEDLFPVKRHDHIAALKSGLVSRTAW